MSADMRPILIAGPTASGKSALAVALAERLGGTVINADSMQVYRELRILTARPAAADEARVPHALYGMVPASEAYSAGRFVSDARGALESACAAARRPIFVSGTGLYFKALLEGLSPIPPVDDEVRAYWRAEAQRSGSEALHALLAKQDPDMAVRLNPADTQRVVRALEVLQSSGRSLSDWQQQPGEPVIGATDCVRLAMLPDREALHARADKRFDQMVEAGAYAEAQALADLGLDPDLPAMRAIGVAPLVAAAAGEISLTAAIERAKAETRQYIKRQETWLHRHMITWNNINSQSMESSMASAFAFIQT